MKAICFFFLSSIFCISIINAQIFNSFEIQTGVALSSPMLERGRIKTFPNNFDGHGGLILEANVFSKIGQNTFIGTGIHYTKVAYSHTLGGILTGEDLINGTVTSLKNEVNISNIGVPILMKLDVGKTKKWGHTVGGLTFYKAFNEISNTTTTGGGLKDPVIRAWQIENISNGFNISAQAGFRIMMPIGKKSHITLGGKVEYFLIPDEYYFDGGKGNILSLGTSLGYMISP
ncbi:MAG: hypothetical protein IPN76_16435 [Saprospiraceae bacterium]|nr:hypothetical protein [Saprospiraceae bacterium]